jgi:hypothetical protein
LIAFSPNPGNVICGNRTTNGTIITIPADSVWCGDIQVSASVAAGTTGTPHVTTSGTGVEPSAGSVVSRLSVTGLALSTVTDSNTISVIVRAPVGNSVTLEFDTGGATSASVVCNGFIL